MEKFVLPKGYVIYFMGVSGSGKSLLAEQLGKIFSVRVIHGTIFDKEIDKNLPLYEKFLKLRDMLCKKVKDLNKKGESFISDNPFVIGDKKPSSIHALNAGFITKEEYNKIIDLTDEEKSLKFPDLIIYANVDALTAVERIGQRNNTIKGFNSKDDTEGFNLWNQGIMSELKDEHSKKTLVIEINNNVENSPEKIAEFICKNLDKKIGYIKYS